MRQSLGDDIDGWLDLALATRVVPSFDKRCLTALYHYPYSQGALARRNPEDASVADRFEIFLGDLELANGYVELTDPVEQAARFNTDNERRRSLSLPVVETDNEFLAALDAGLPPCAGVAVGFDRLLLAELGADHIDEVISFRPGGHHEN